MLCQCTCLHGLQLGLHENIRYRLLSVSIIASAQDFFLVHYSYHGYTCIIDTISLLHNTNVDSADFSAVASHLANRFQLPNRLNFLFSTLLFTYNDTLLLQNTGGEQGIQTRDAANAKLNTRNAFPPSRTFYTYKIILEGGICKFIIIARHIHYLLTSYRKIRLDFGLTLNAAPRYGHVIFHAVFHRPVSSQRAHLVITAPDSTR